MVKVHDAATYVQAGQRGHQIVEEERHQRVENNLRVLQEWQRAVAEEGDVAIVDDRNHEQGVAEQSR